MIADQVREFVLEKGEGKRIADLRIGLGYTSALLNDGKAGVAYTFKESLPDGCSVFTGNRPLAGKSIQQVINYIGSPVLLESSVGIAVANALINREREGEKEGDVLDILKLDKDDRVGMVGFFGPLVAPLKKRVRELTIFERSIRMSKGFFPAEKAAEELPACDIALITSTSLINGTMDSLIDSARKCREIVLLGASTVLAPEIFQPLGVTLLSGVIVTDPPTILQIVSEGGGMRFFKNHIKKVNIRLN
ncbi:MAG: DUF364 domain-containing protein [Proteobacteria bacterium]|nr:DUF364 domain-containing protein [Pseudomonadota bacterium]